MNGDRPHNMEISHQKRLPVARGIACSNSPSKFIFVVSLGTFSQTLFFSGLSKEFHFSEVACLIKNVLQIRFDVREHILLFLY